MFRDFNLEDKQHSEKIIFCFIIACLVESGHLLFYKSVIAQCIDPIYQILRKKASLPVLRQKSLDGSRIIIIKLLHSYSYLNLVKV